MKIRQTLFAATALVTLSANAPAPQPDLRLGTLAQIGTVHERYQAYNV